MLSNFWTSLFWKHVYSSSPTLPREWFLTRITFTRVSKCLLVSKEIIILPLCGWRDIRYQKIDRWIRKSLASLLLNFWLPMIETHCLVLKSVFFIPLATLAHFFFSFPLLLPLFSVCTVSSPVIIRQIIDMNRSIWIRHCDENNIFIQTSAIRYTLPMFD